MSKITASFYLDIFFDYSYSYCLVGPGKLNKDVIAEVMLDVMPRKISAELAAFESFEPVMENFLSWCEENKHLSNTIELREHIHEIAEEIIARSQSPSYWGIAKSFMMVGFPGANLIDFYDFNEAIEATGYWGKPETYRRENEKIGRNDSCSCGSGKKYKKCCLLTSNA